MAGGRPRKPDAIKAASGTLRADRKIDEMKSTEGIAPYSHTELADEKVVYSKLSEMFQHAGIAGREDSIALRQLANAFVQWHKTKKMVDDMGEFYETTSTSGHKIIKENPAAKALRDWDKRLSEHLAKFGATPAARSSIAKMNSETDAATMLLDMFSNKFQNTGKQNDMFSVTATLPAERAIN
ncbi:P27 family phage terminase small subunit [Catenovulum sediminis]|uniref:P27 family phage terminase small subunit n=1 Tax=Catenovulum sediminis TaxID=1740262 RepID=A0ABV1RKU5_9ALTE|nr:P27 family phage terminase small subunit [Catenovulum sediminis]